MSSPPVLYQLKINTYDYQRGICKIIYELACHWLGDAYLDDPVASLFRNVILSGTEEKITGQIRLSGNEPPLSLWQGEPKAHIAMGSQQGDAGWIAVRVFDAVSGVLCVTKTASKYPSFIEGRFLLMDLAGAASRSSTLNEEIFRIVRRNR